MFVSKKCKDTPKGQYIDHKKNRYDRRNNFFFGLYQKIAVLKIMSATLVNFRELIV